MNFALPKWIEIGSKAGHCKCRNDSVTMEVARLFGQDPLLSSRPNVKRKPVDLLGPKQPGKKLMYAKEAPEKRIKFDGPICVLCGGSGENGSLVTSDMEGKLAHVECGQGVPETSVGTSADGKPIVMGIMSVPKGRWNLKCDICKIVKTSGDFRSAGAPIQCKLGKCKRAFHVACAKRYIRFINAAERIRATSWFSTLSLNRESVFARNMTPFRFQPEKRRKRRFSSRKLSHSLPVRRSR